MGSKRGLWTAATSACGPVIVGVVLLAVGTAGCTMCPDPFDYSGPVPNGSAAQNDFEARSNGILPLRAAPSPWPPVVEDAPSEAEPATPEPILPGSVLKLADEPGEPITR